MPIRQGPSGPVTGVHVVGEVLGPVGEAAARTASIESAGPAVLTLSAEIPPGERTVSLRVPLPNASVPVDVRARLGADTDEPVSDAIRCCSGAA